MESALGSISGDSIPHYAPSCSTQFANDPTTAQGLVDAEIDATTQDVTQWFRGHLGTPITTLPTSSKQAPQRVQLPTPIHEAQLPSDGRSSRRESQARTGFVGDTPLSGKPFVSSQLFDVLRQAIDNRQPEVEWRTTKSYSAAEVNGITFLAIMERRSHLVLGLTLPSTTVADRLSDNAGEFNWARITKVIHLQDERDIDEGLLAIIEAARSHAETESRSKAHYGVTLRDLIASGLLEVGTPLTLFGAGNRDTARATLSARGEIEYNGNSYRSLSDKVFAKLLGRTSLNGWTHWHAILPEGSVPLDTIRTRYWGLTRNRQSPESSAASGSV